MTRQYPLPLPHRETMTGDDYIVTASNRDAFNMVSEWPLWNAHCMLILGPAGSGKSHLKNLWLEKSHGKNVKLDDLESQDAGQLAMSNSIIAIDDIDTVAGIRASEVTIFHLYNLLKETKGYLLLTATRPPAMWNMALADLRSRILASPVATIAPPNDELLTMLLVKQFHDRQIEISEEVISYLLTRMERTTSAVRDMVKILDHVSLAEGKPVTVSFIKRVLEDEARLPF